MADTVSTGLVERLANNAMACDMNGLRDTAALFREAAAALRARTGVAREGELREQDEKLTALIEGVTDTAYALGVAPIRSPNVGEYRAAMEVAVDALHEYIAEIRTRTPAESGAAE